PPPTNDFHSPQASVTLNATLLATPGVCRWTRSVACEVPAGRLTVAPTAIGLPLSTAVAVSTRVTVMLRHAFVGVATEGCAAITACTRPEPPRAVVTATVGRGLQKVGTEVACGGTTAVGVGVGAAMVNGALAALLSVAGSVPAPETLAVAENVP